MLRSCRSTTISVVGSVSISFHSCSTTSWRHLGRDEAGLAGVAAEDVGEAAGDHDLEAVVHQRPHGVLARRPGAEVGAGDEHGGAVVLRPVDDELRVLAPGREQPVLEAGAGDPLEVDRRDDLVGVDVAAPQRQAGAGVPGELLHDVSPSGQASGGRSEGEASVPVTAVAAATSGETRCVRPPLPCRPSKLRFDVEALRSPGSSWSGFMPRHIEQPAPRHSPPASLKTTSRPSSSACSRTRNEPGHDEQPGVRRDVPALDHLGGGPQVLDAAVGAGADEDRVDLDLAHRGAGLETHVLQGLLGGDLVALVLEVRGARHAWRRAGRPGRGWCPR